jgi:hypothetical protein
VFFLPLPCFHKIKKSHPFPEKGPNSPAVPPNLAMEESITHFLSYNAGIAPQFAAELQGRLGHERYKDLPANGLLSGIRHHLLILFNVLPYRHHLLK